jgi:hypothetical protein
MQVCLGGTVGAWCKLVLGPDKVTCQPVTVNDDVREADDGESRDRLGEQNEGDGVGDSVRYGWSPVLGLLNGLMVRLDDVIAKAVSNEGPDEG